MELLGRLEFLIVAQRSEDIKSVGILHHGDECDRMGTATATSESARNTGQYHIQWEEEMKSDADGMDNRQRRFFIRTPNSPRKSI